MQSIPLFNMILFHVLVSIALVATAAATFIYGSRGLQVSGRWRSWAQGLITLLSLVAFNHLT